jgi:hypothetical protein
MPGARNGTALVGIGIGIIMFGAAAYAGQPGLGAALLAIMVGYAAILWLGQRNDVIQVLRGEPADERYEHMLQKATSFAANVLAIVVIAMFVYEIATDGNPGPYSLMGFVFGVSLIGSLVWQRFTS